MLNLLAADVITRSDCTKLRVRLLNNKQTFGRISLWPVALALCIHLPSPQNLWASCVYWWVKTQFLRKQARMEHEWEKQSRGHRSPWRNVGQRTHTRAENITQKVERLLQHNKKIFLRTWNSFKEVFLAEFSVRTRLDFEPSSVMGAQWRNIPNNECFCENWN